MAFEKLLDHRCDIYHLKKIKNDMGYGLSSREAFEYSKKPDEKNVPCHFGVESLETDVRQKNPQNVLQEKIKLALPCGVDVRINDKIVDLASGLEYTAGRPRNIRNHHIFVYIERTKNQEAL